VLGNRVTLHLPFAAGTIFRVRLTEVISEEPPSNGRAETRGPRLAVTFAQARARFCICVRGFPPSARREGLRAGVARTGDDLKAGQAAQFVRELGEFFGGDGLESCDCRAVLWEIAAGVNRPPFWHRA